MTGDMFPAERRAVGSFYSFFYIYLFWLHTCACENNSTKDVRIVIKFHTAAVPLGGDTLILPFQPSSSTPWRDFPLHPAVVMTTMYTRTNKPPPRPLKWIHTGTLMWFIQIHCACDTCFIPEICIYLFSLYLFLSLSWRVCDDIYIKESYEADAANNASMIAVMCGVRSQGGLSEG